MSQEELESSFIAPSLVGFHQNPVNVPGERGICRADGCKTKTSCLCYGCGMAFGFPIFICPDHWELIHDNMQQEVVYDQRSDPESE